MTGPKTFFSDEQGQDLIEYSLMLAFVALASAALFIGAGGSVQGIWSGAADLLGYGDYVAAGGGNQNQF